MRPPFTVRYERYERPLFWNYGRSFSVHELTTLYGRQTVNRVVTEETRRHSISTNTLIYIFGKQYLYRSSIRRPTSSQTSSECPTCLPRPSFCFYSLQFSAVRVPCTFPYLSRVADPSLW